MSNEQVLADRRFFPMRPADGGRAPAAVTAVRLRRRKSNLRFNARVKRVYSAPKTISADRNVSLNAATAGKRERSEPRTFGAQCSGPKYDPPEDERRPKRRWRRKNGSSVVGGGSCAGLDHIRPARARGDTSASCGRRGASKFACCGGFGTYAMLLDIARNLCDVHGW